MPLNKTQKILIDGILSSCDAQLRLIDAYAARLENLKISCRQSTQGAIESLHFLFHMQGVPLRIRLLINIQEHDLLRLSLERIFAALDGINIYLSDAKKYYIKFRTQALGCRTATPDSLQKEIDYLHEIVRTATAVMLADHQKNMHLSIASVKRFVSKENKKYVDEMVLEDYIYDFDLLEIMLANIAKHIGPVQKRFIEIQKDPEIERQTSKTTQRIKQQQETFDPSLNKVMQASVNALNSITETGLALCQRVEDLSAVLNEDDPRLSKAMATHKLLIQKIEQAQRLYDVNFRALGDEVNAKMQEVGAMDLSGRQALEYKRKVTVLFIGMQTILLQVQEIEKDVSNLEQRAVEQEAAEEKVVAESWKEYFETKAKSLLPSFITTKLSALTLVDVATERTEVSPAVVKQEQTVVPVVEEHDLHDSVRSEIEETKTVDYDAVIAESMKEARRVKDLEKTRKQEAYAQSLASASELTDVSYDSDCSEDDQDYNALFDKEPQQSSSLAENVAALGSKNRQLLIELVTSPQNALNNKYKYSQLRKLTRALKGEILKGKGSHRKFRLHDIIININIPENEPENEQTKSAVAGVPLPKNKRRLDSGFLNGVYVSQFRDALIELGIKQYLGIEAVEVASARSSRKLRG